MCFSVHIRALAAFYHLRVTKDAATRPTIRHATPSQTSQLPRVAARMKMPKPSMPHRIHTPRKNKRLNRMTFLALLSSTPSMAVHSRTTSSNYQAAAAYDTPATATPFPRVRLTIAVTYQYTIVAHTVQL